MVGCSRSVAAQSPTPRIALGRRKTNPPPLAARLNRTWGLDSYRQCLRIRSMPLKTRKNDHIRRLMRGTAARDFAAGQVVDPGRVRSLLIATTQSPWQLSQCRAQDGCSTIWSPPARRGRADARLFNRFRHSKSSQGHADFVTERSRTERDPPVPRRYPAGRHREGSTFNSRTLPRWLAIRRRHDQLRQRHAL